MYCDLCQSVLCNPERDISEDSEYHKDIPSLQLAAEQECWICYRTWHKLIKEYWQINTLSENINFWDKEGKEQAFLERINSATLHDSTPNLPFEDSSYSDISNRNTVTRELTFSVELTWLPEDDEWIRVREIFALLPMRGMCHQYYHLVFTNSQGHRRIVIYTR